MPIPRGPFPQFWRQPIAYMRWASHEKPAIWYSILIGLVGPVGLLINWPIRSYFGIERRPAIPVTYPVPTGPRQKLSGFEDD